MADFQLLISAMILKCPRCGNETESAGNPYRPFCCERCKIIDLGNWISGGYAIPVNSADEENGKPLPPRKDTDDE